MQANERTMKKPRKLIQMKIFLLLFLSYGLSPFIMMNQACYAQNNNAAIIPTSPHPASAEQMNRYVAPLVQQRSQHPELSLGDLTEMAARIILEDQIPYQGGLTGEGLNGKFDQDPLVTYDGLDCTTFVEACMTAAVTANEQKKSIRSKKMFKQFIQNAKKIKYSSNVIEYQNRCHFAEVDWLEHLQSLGIIEDQTLKLDPTAPLATKVISKKDWYQNKTAQDLRLYSNKTVLDSTAVQIRLQEFKELGSQFADQNPELRYITLERLLDPEVQNKFPKLLIFNLIKGKHSTANPPVMISHQGFLVRHDDHTLHIIHAAVGKKVLEQPFDEYIRLRMQDRTWPTLGMNFQMIMNSN
jgi:hypothetical protein